MKPADARKIDRRTNDPAVRRAALEVARLAEPAGQPDEPDYPYAIAARSELIRAGGNPADLWTDAHAIHQAAAEVTA